MHVDLVSSGAVQAEGGHALSKRGVEKNVPTFCNDVHQGVSVRGNEFGSGPAHYPSNFLFYRTLFTAPAVEFKAAGDPMLHTSFPYKPLSLVRKRMAGSGYRRRQWPKSLWESYLRYQPRDSCLMDGLSLPSVNAVHNAPLEAWGWLSGTGTGGEYYQAQV